MVGDVYVGIAAARRPRRAFIAPAHPCATRDDSGRSVHTHTHLGRTRLDLVEREVTGPDEGHENGFLDFGPTEDIDKDEVVNEKMVQVIVIGARQRV